MPRGIPNNKAGHVSREQESWSADAIHDTYKDGGKDEGVLPEIPAREGFDKRWIRTRIGGEDDPRNLAKAFNKGWRRRDPATIPPNIGAPTTYVEGVGESVGMSGMFLAERPKKLSAVHKRRVDDRTNAQMAAVDGALDRSHDANDSGFGKPVRTGKTQIQTGVMPVFDD